MKILICCSKHFYDKIPPIKQELESQGHKIQVPTSYEKPMKEEELKNMSEEEHQKWKAEMIRKHDPNIRGNDAILVLNLEKNGQPNYIGGATFLEIYKAFEIGKEIYLYNPIPEDMIFTDELKGMNPKVIMGDLSKIN